MFSIPPWVWQVSVGVLLCVMNVLGVGLTALTLPGIWLMLLCAGLAQWWHVWQYKTEMFSWWTLGACAALAVIAEVIEMVASALGASKFGATKTGALGAVIGAILGAIIGSFILFFVGTIVGAAVGAGVGALLIERHIKSRSWEEATKAGTGAAIGRLAATLVKVGIAVVVAVVLSVAAFV